MSSKSARPAKDFKSSETVSIAESAQCPLVRCAAQPLSRRKSNEGDCRAARHRFMPGSTSSQYTAMAITAGAQSETNVPCGMTLLGLRFSQRSPDAAHWPRRIFFIEFAFPYADNLPTSPLESSRDDPIPCDRPRKFWEPKIPATFWYVAKLAIGMSVPKTAIDKQGDAVAAGRQNLAARMQLVLSTIRPSRVA